LDGTVAPAAVPSLFSGVTFAARAVPFFTGLRAPRVPRGVGVMNPYRDAAVRGYTAAYFERFFSDSQPRTLVFGINPGRFGAGVTGIAFTDPVALADFCGVPNDLARRRELSSVFIYQMMSAMGGVGEFCSRFFLTALSPLGYTRGGVNLNYYDEPALERAVTPFIVRGVKTQIAFGGRTDRAFVLGRGKNLKFVQALNDRHKFFGEVIGLDHPRFIMQYRRKKLTAYIDKYLATLGMSTFQVTG
jgi:hypothetical protein